MTDYRKPERELCALSEGVPHCIANLANASAFLFERPEGINRAGFYMLSGTRGGRAGY